MSFNWISDSSWEDVEVDEEFRDQVWRPYTRWKKRAEGNGVRSASVADYGGEFLKGLTDYYEIDTGEVDGSAMGNAAALAALGDESANLEKVLAEETVSDERKLKYYLDKEFENEGLFSGLRDYF